MLPNSPFQLACNFLRALQVTVRNALFAERLAIKDFFDSPSNVKGIFDNVSRFMQSTAVTLGGGYLFKERAMQAQNRIATECLGYFIFVVGIILLLINIAHGYHHVKKRHPRFAPFFFLAYACFSVGLVLSILFAKGMKLA